MVISQHMIGRNAILLSTENVPQMQTLIKMNVQELINLTISKIEWYGSIETLGFTLSDGQSCRGSGKRDFNNCHTFDPKKKITRVECIIAKSEYGIFRISFFSDEETLYSLGWMNLSDEIFEYGGRVETFHISEDE